MAGCGADSQELATATHLLRARAESCQAGAASIAEAWRASIGSNVSIDDAVRGAMGSERYRRSAKKSLGYDARFQTLFAKLRGGLDSDLLSAVVDLQSDVEALCKLSLDPGGYTLLSYSSKVADIRSDADRSASKVEARIGTKLGADKARDIDLAVEVEAAK